MSAPGVDIFDDDYWRGFAGIMERRKGYFDAMHRLDELSRKLTRQADEEYEQRQAAEPAADRERRENRERMLKELIVRADSATDPGEAEKLWAAVYAFLRGPGAES